MFGPTTVEKIVGPLQRIVRELGYHAEAEDSRADGEAEEAHRLSMSATARRDEAGRARTIALRMANLLEG